MISSKDSTIDEIKKKYEYELDPLNYTDTACVIYCLLHGNFCYEFEKYAFEENIKKIRKGMQDKGDKIDKNTLQSYDELLKEISENSEKIREKVHSYYKENVLILAAITIDYKDNRNKPGAKDIYVKIGRDIIDKGVNLFIKYEKILISYNDHINSIKKKFLIIKFFLFFINFN